MLKEMVIFVGFSVSETQKQLLRRNKKHKPAEEATYQDTKKKKGVGVETILWEMLGDCNCPMGVT